MKAKCKKTKGDLNCDFKLKVKFDSRDELETLISLVDWGVRNACTVSERHMARNILQSLQECVDE
jgi:hypothetical protein